MEFLKEKQLDIMLFLSGLCAALSVIVFVSKSIPVKRRSALAFMEIGSTVLLIADRNAYIYRGDTSALGFYMVRICNFSVYFLTLFILLAFNMCLKDLFEDADKGVKYPVLLRAADILLALGELSLIVSQFTGFYYTFDESNTYKRGSGIFIWFSIPFIIYVLQFISIIIRRRMISTRMLVSILLSTLLPFAASVAQIFLYGLSLTNITIVSVAIILFLFSLVDMDERVSKAKEHEIELLKEEQETMQLLFEQTASALASAIDAKDKYTHGHSRRVAEYSQKIAEYAGKDATETREIYYSALLHDVGKIGVPDVIINKEGKLTDEEFAAIKTHPTIGSQILSSINISPYLSIGASYHHERYDGRGYPSGLKGDDIPEIARIIAVADAYDAMTSKRSYRDPLPQQLVREELVKGMETQFDPEFAKIMLHLIDIDTEYQMKEHEEIKELSGRSELECKEFRTEFSDGILLTRNEIKIHIRSTAGTKDLSPR